MDRSRHDHGGTSSLQLATAGARERVWALAKQMSEREYWPRARLLEYQQARLREFVQHALATSAYYREEISPQILAKASRGHVDLHELPVLTKATVASEFDRIVTDRRLKLGDAERHLAGEHPSEPLLDEYRVVGSGGTTGQRTIVAYDTRGWESALAGFLHLLATQGIAADERLVGIGAPTPFHMSNRVFAELRAGQSGAPRLAVTTRLPDVAEALNAYQPQAVFTYPSFIRSLAHEQRAGRLHIAPRTFCSVAETLTRDVRELVRATWDVPVLDAYCTTEAGAIASECPFGNGLHVIEQALILEVVDENYRPVPSGVIGHRVLITPLGNRVLPLIRYEFSDLVSVADEACPCGRHHLRLASIDGRREDVLSLPARAGGHVDVRAGLLGEPLLRLPAIRQYQLTPLPAGLLIRVVLADADQAKDTLTSARAIMQAELDRAGAQLQVLRIEVVDRIEPIGSGAKHRPVGPRA